jgi:arabinofuranosyltransferase
MPARKAYVALCSIALGIFLLDAWRHGAQVVDDAYIALRYARNLVDGLGLVYNTGERVEGYTSIVFVLFAAACLKVGIDPIAGWKALSLAAAAATLAGAARLERVTALRADAPGAAAEAAATGGRLGGSADLLAGRPLSPLLLLPLPAFAYWSFGTLEAMALAACLVWGVALGWREVETGRFRGSAVAFALAALTRPEGAPLFAVATVALALAEWRLAVRGMIGGGQTRPHRRFLLRHLVNVAVVSTAFGLHLVWRLAYYGDWRPNTYYAKVTGGSEQLLTGLQYLGGFARAFPILAIATVALPLLLRRAKVASAAAASEEPPPEAGRGRGAGAGAAAVIAAVAFAEIALTVALGGDSQPFHRFFIPALPLLAVLGAWAARLLLSPRPLGSTTIEPPTRDARHARFLPTAALGLFALHVALAHATTQPYVAFVADRTTKVGAAVGSFFATRLAPDDMIATNTAGSLPYRSERAALDTLGLTDATIAKRPVFISSTGWAAHRRGWGEYVLRRHPRVILFYNTAGSREPFYLGDRELLDLPGFRFFYRLRTAPLPPLEDTIAWPAARYPGFPFGRHPSGRIVSPDLGLEARFFTRPFGYTVFGQGPITVTWFETERRDDALWSALVHGREAGGELGAPARDQVPAFVEAVAERWRSLPPPVTIDPAARVRIEAQCDLALAAIERGDHDTAKTILAAAAAANSDARSPRVFRYVANLAAMTGDLHTALAAQKELLRLEPADPLARSNLAHLLSVPAADFGRLSSQYLRPQPGD